MKRNPRFQLVRTERETVRWRLLGGNNASLGTGTDEFPAPEACSAAIGWLGRHVDELTPELSHTSGGRWRWRLRVDAVLVAEATHAYGRRIEAQRGLDRFRAGVALAATGGAFETITDWRIKYRARPAGKSR